jgi:hypothetical protein
MPNKEPPLHGKPQCKFTCTLEMDEQSIENLDLSNNIWKLLQIPCSLTVQAEALW